jgi:hypothetical protein
MIGHHSTLVVVKLRAALIDSERSGYGANFGDEQVRLSQAPK